jgi:hypothetical protein
VLKWRGVTNVFIAFNLTEVPFTTVHMITDEGGKCTGEEKRFTAAAVFMTTAYSFS